MTRFFKIGEKGGKVRITSNILTVLLKTTNLMKAL